MRRLKAAWQAPGDRLVILIVAIVVLFLAAVGVAIVRYDQSRSADAKAINERETQFFAQQVRTEVTDEGGVADAYASDGDKADLADLARIRHDLAKALR